MNRLDFLRRLAATSIAMMTMSLQDLDNFLQSKKNSERMPALFLGHGSPMNAIEDNTITRSWQALGKALPKPTAIVSISAHWMTNGKTQVTAMSMPRTIHDFGGFPKRLFEQQYPAKGDPELAKQLQKELKFTHLGHDHSWGLDHGTWSVLMHLYPEADIPVIQLSLDMSRRGEWHHEFGQALSRWRDQGVLFVGSGNIVHNLRMLDWNLDQGGYDWAEEFDLFAAKKIQEGHHQPLFDYQKLGKAAQLSIPTPDHYWPLLYILGMKKSGDQVDFPTTALQMGGISMRSVLLS